MSIRAAGGKCLTALVLLATLFSVMVPVSAQMLKGGVEEENLKLNRNGGGGTQLRGAADSLRISRAPLQASAVDANAFAQAQSPRMDNSGPMKGVVDDGAFAQPPKNFDIGAERGSKELTLAWEKWHKQLSQQIYQRWQSIVREPGKATIRLTVTRDHFITAQILHSSGSATFDETVLAAINSLNGNPGLTFPFKSERHEVSFEADYIAATNVTPGFSWVKNDYEHIKENY